MLPVTVSVQVAIPRAAEVDDHVPVKKLFTGLSETRSVCDDAAVFV